MQYEESYLVTLTTSDGKVISETYDDVEEALRDYRQALRLLSPGAKVELRRVSSVTLASAAKAR